MARLYLKTHYNTTLVTTTAMDGTLAQLKCHLYNWLPWRQSMPRLQRFTPEFNFRKTISTLKPFFSKPLGWDHKPRMITQMSVVCSLVRDRRTGAGARARTLHSWLLRVWAQRERGKQLLAGGQSREQGRLNNVTTLTLNIRWCTSAADSPLPHHSSLFTHSFVGCWFRNL